ncbi:MAG: SH3 domain-containing protein [Candidatus Rhabdochlamydia sp.]
MSKCHFSISLLFGISCLSLAFANGGDDLSHIDPFTSFSEQSFGHAASSKAFVPFTGKVKAQKVRIRAFADTDSPVVKELSRDDLIVVVGEKGDFYAVEPAQGTKAYVFRTFVLNGAIEGNRVNIRLQPSLEAPIIAHLNQGDLVQEKLCASNTKWYEITPPAGTKFYVAKEYIQSIGGPEVKLHLDQKRNSAEELLLAAQTLSQSEIKKPFRDINLDQVKGTYQTLIQEFADFSDLCKKAKEALIAFQEAYTERKMSFLEGSSLEMPSQPQTPSHEQLVQSATDRMKMWEPVEESLYLTWSSYHDEQSVEDFYAQERQGAVVLTGIIEPFTSFVKKKPGDYVLKDRDLPLAYLYSTHVNLQDFVGKKVSIQAAPRSNNHFAFPAYFVISAE